MIPGIATKIATKTEAEVEPENAIDKNGRIKVKCVRVIRMKRTTRHAQIG